MHTLTRRSPMATAARAVLGHAAMRGVARWLEGLVAEHTAAHRAAAMAELPRERLRDLRALYTEARSRNGQETAAR